MLGAPRSGCSTAGGILPEQNPSPSPAAHPAFGAALDALGLWGSRHTLKQSDGCGAEKSLFNSILYIETSSESMLVYYKII